MDSREIRLEKAWTPTLLHQRVWDRTWTCIVIIIIVDLYSVSELGVLFSPASAGTLILCEATLYANTLGCCGMVSRTGVFDGSMTKGR
jgi:hypothetical protein